MTYGLRVEAKDGCIHVRLDGHYEMTDFGPSTYWRIAGPPGLLARLLGDTFEARVPRLIRQTLRLKARLEARDAVVERAQKAAETLLSAAREEGLL